MKIIQSHDVFDFTTMGLVSGLFHMNKGTGQ
jgi:hypothetical protein